MSDDIMFLYVPLIFLQVASLHESPVSTAGNSELRSTKMRGVQCFNCDAKCHEKWSVCACVNACSKIMN
jgi:hypothetical protein